MAEDSYWVERAQSAEAKLATCQQNQDRVKEKLRHMMEALGAKERRDGAIDIDFEALAGKLSLEHWLELRAAGDEVHRVSGAPGEKPRIKVTAVP